MHNSDIRMAAANFAKRFPRAYFGGEGKATTQALQCPYSANGLLLPGWWLSVYNAGIEAKACFSFPIGLKIKAVTHY